MKVKQQEEMEISERFNLMEITERYIIVNVNVTWKLDTFGQGWQKSNLI